MRASKISLNPAQGVVVRIAKIKWEHGLWAFSEGGRKEGGKTKREGKWKTSIAEKRDWSGTDQAMIVRSRK